MVPACDDEDAAALLATLEDELSTATAELASAEVAADEVASEAALDTATDVTTELAAADAGAEETAATLDTAAALETAATELDAAEEIVQHLFSSLPPQATRDAAKSVISDIFFNIFITPEIGCAPAELHPARTLLLVFLCISSQKWQVTDFL